MYAIAQTSIIAFSRFTSVFNIRNSFVKSAYIAYSNVFKRMFVYSRQINLNAICELPRPYGRGFLVRR